MTPTQLDNLIAELEGLRSGSHGKWSAEGNKLYSTMGGAKYNIGDIDIPLRANMIAAMHEAIPALIAAVKELRGALKPFAELAGNWSPSFADTQGFILSPMSNPQPGDLVFKKDVTMGDLRSAAALAGGGE